MPFFLALFLILFSSCQGQELKCNNDYNLKGKVKQVEETTTHSDFEMKTIYSLNVDGYLLEMEDYSANKLIEKKEYTYKNGIIRQLKTFDSNGKEISNRDFIINDQNQIEKTIVSSLNGERTIKYQYEGNSKLPDSGNELDKNGKKIRSWKLAYKNNLVSIHRNYTADGKMTSQTFYTYNLNNDLVELIEKDGNNKITHRQSSEYQRDEHQNWIEKKVYDENKVLISTSIRKIKYW
ncbi:MAG: hypothetical protein PHQ74_02760 [Crocinitomicaceae bacterium]|nr:hypothetical protein [Crocinitomicaceae bacterium]